MSFHGFPQRSTQGPHRPTNKSQISPTTQTPSPSISGEGGDGAGRFAFGLAAGRAAAAAAANVAIGSQGVGSPSSILGLSGGIVGRGGVGGGGEGVAELGAAAAGDRLTVISLEIHVQIGSDRRPDPRRDAVHAVCWRVKDAFSSAEREVVETSSGVIVLPLARSFRGAMVREGSRGDVETTARDSGGSGGSEDKKLKETCCLKCGEIRDDDARVYCTFEGGGFLGQGVGGRGTFCHGLGKRVEALEVCSEAQLMRALVGVFCRHDPDFVVGWEVQGDSLGYLVERGFNMVREPSAFGAEVWVKTI